MNIESRVGQKPEKDRKVRQKPRVMKDDKPL